MLNGFQKAKTVFSAGFHVPLTCTLRCNHFYQLLFLCKLENIIFLHRIFFKLFYSMLSIAEQMHRLDFTAQHQ